MLADLAAFVSKLEAAIDDTMQGAVAEGAKEALQEAAYRQVYDTYTPQFLSRRPRKYDGELWRDDADHHR